MPRPTAEGDCRRAAQEEYGGRDWMTAPPGRYASLVTRGQRVGERLGARIPLRWLFFQATANGLLQHTCGATLCRDGDNRHLFADRFLPLTKRLASERAFANQQFV